MVLLLIISTDSGFIIQIPAHVGKRETDPLHYATSCPFTPSCHFTKPSAELTLLWWKNLLLNKLSRIRISKLISFLTDNEDLIKQQPDAITSSNLSNLDCNPHFYPSSRP
ncbi:hypothetical protein AVEN_93449-1 [Araneus ventricosus]|uniref:Uncharacterized protein n=1 Tax=Araneus ventricosus TaxID=182803 RepID=A0A4Y2APC1_ARAVE|nr:hypothetical protein AVEN_93449-1 [Araneus ventricosus]